MENLWWARILVKPKGGELPSLLEIGVEGSSYYLPLWWEVSPLFRQNSEGYRGSSGRCSGEVRGDGDARAAREWRSGLTQGSRRCHGQLMGRKGRWSGWVGIWLRARFNSGQRPGLQWVQLGCLWLDLLRTRWAWSGLGGLFCKLIDLLTFQTIKSFLIWS